MMTPEQIDKLTLGEVRAIVERATDTLSKLREVQSLLAGSAPVDAVRPGAQSVARPAASRPVFDAEHEARKAALLAQNMVNVEELPEDLQAVERAAR